ncbi:MAG: hypothetical protein O7G30_06670 [Proteobacteria bacterium]|nr:hypothetical protein [Pseudomonadota bacterium]
MRISRTLLVPVLAAAVATLAPAPEAGAQIAAGYPGDAGLDQDPRVILYEDFEAGSVSDLSNRWDQVLNADGMSFTSGVPSGSAGSRALRVTASGNNTSAHLYTRLASTPDTLYLRAYVRYMGGAYHHAGPWLGGYNPATPYPQGGSGERPLGNERFTVGFEPIDAQNRLDFYSYYMGMTGFGPGQYWGNSFIQDPSLRVRLGEWMCFEVMVKMNDPVGSSNGELAAWVDGQQVAHLGPGFPNVVQTGPAVWTPDPNGPPSRAFSGATTLRSATTSCGCCCSPMETRSSSGTTSWRLPSTSARSTPVRRTRRIPPTRRTRPASARRGRS